MTGPNFPHLSRCSSVRMLTRNLDENLIALNFPRPSVRTLTVNSCEPTSSPRPSTGAAPSKSLDTSYEFVTTRVEGSRVMIAELEMHRIRLYLPRQECLTTMYRARYSGSSATAGAGGAGGGVGSAGGGWWSAETEAACRLTKSIEGRCSR